jgi:hypothetical protein
LTLSLRLCLPAHAVFRWLALSLTAATFGCAFATSFLFGFTLDVSAALRFGAACTRRHAVFRRARCSAGAFSRTLCRCEADARGRASMESNPILKAEWENLAETYVRLAEQSYDECETELTYDPIQDMLNRTRH